MADRPRVGIGFDSHRFSAGRPLVLGCLEIPFDKGLTGHSDADVVAHAVIDALLGAAALGDIGQHFPDSDQRWHGADSGELLAQTVALLGEHGWQAVNVDTTVVAEEPRLDEYKPLMRAALARCMGLAVDSVSVKATSNERMGAIGRGEGIAALATVLIDSQPAACTPAGEERG